MRAQDILGTLSPLRAAVLRAALGEDGVRESTGKNDGLVERYMPRWAKGQGHPYCAWFVGWAFHRGTGEYPFWQHTGAVHVLLEQARGDEAVVDLSSAWPARGPQPGDIFVVLHDDRRGHCGLIVSVDAKIGDASRFTTIEGNLRNGVRQAERRFVDVDAVINPYSRFGEDVCDSWQMGLIPGLLQVGPSYERTR